jgi:hypothetical protein
MYYIDSLGNYYEGDKADHRDREVTKRPDHTYLWTGDKWEIDPEIIRGNHKMDIFSTDFQMCRVVEDIIQILIDKNIIKKKDFQDAGMQVILDKIAARVTLRAKINA